MGDEIIANGSTSVDVAPSPADWRPFMSDDLKADPIVSSWAEKASEKDIPSVLKAHAHLTKRLGSSINLPGKDAKPEEMQALKQRLYDAGVIQAPPKDVSAYNITKPEKLQDGVNWNDGLAKSFGDTLLKHGASPEMAKDMLALYETAMAGAQTSLNTTAETSMAALREEHKEKFDERMEMAERLAQGIFTDPEEIEFFKSTGIGRSPRFLSAMMRLAPLAMQDSSFVDSLPSQGGEVSGEGAKTELTAIMTDPKHPMHDAYHRRDPAVNRHIDGLYRRAYSNGQAAGG